VDSEGTVIEPNTNRQLTYTFNYDIEAEYYTLTTGTTALSALLTLTTADTDGDADTTTLGTTAASTDGSLPTGLSISVSSNVLTITLSATDADLTTGATVTAGTLDTDDALTWGLNAVVNGINIRRTATADNNAWTALTAVTDITAHTFAPDSLIIVRSQ
jgi:hypothetical protein